jgi:CheY-like chemotaxis protein
MMRTLECNFPNIPLDVIQNAVKNAVKRNKIKPLSSSEAGSGPTFPAAEVQKMRVILQRLEDRKTRISGVGSKSILIVEDVEEHRKGLAGYLSGYRLGFAGTVEQAARLLLNPPNAKWDLVLLDLGLPENEFDRSGRSNPEQGLKILNQCRALQVPAIVVSGTLAIKHRNALSETATPVVIKPVDDYNIQHKVRKTLGSDS